MKKLIFSGGLVIALTFGLTVNGSNLGEVSIDSLGGKAKCNHNTIQSTGSMTSWCSGTVCDSALNSKGNYFRTCA